MVGDNHEEYERIGAELTNLVKNLEPFANQLVGENSAGGIANIIK